jgi:hypothetical protein
MPQFVDGEGVAHASAGGGLDHVTRDLAMLL